jgi:exodeoxyribonuclease V beta subunit
MLSRVADSLGGTYGEDLVAALRGQYRYAVVDEFQDTDNLQWRIFRRIFFESESRNPLYVIGEM